MLIPSTLKTIKLTFCKQLMPMLLLQSNFLPATFANDFIIKWKDSFFSYDGKTKTVRLPEGKSLLPYTVISIFTNKIFN